MTGPYDGPQFTQHVLERARVVAMSTVNRGLLTDSLAADFAVECTGESLMMRLTAVVLREHLVSDTYTAQLPVPASWWQHLKHDHAPAWFTRRWPVRHVTWRRDVRFDRYATYPRATWAVPPELGQVVLYEEITPLPWKETA